MQPKPLILFIDAYDSFSNNIISLLETNLNVAVRTVKIDDKELLASDTRLHRELRNYVAIVCGPGPGNPENQEDVGLIKKIWKLGVDEMLPVLGICLGFQSLCLEFGGKIKRLKVPQHGIVRRVTHIGEHNEKNNIFFGVGQVEATLYQSLCVDIGHDALSRKEWESEMWNQTEQCPNLLPLAWVDCDFSVSSNSDTADERILVAVQHNMKPFWALQYHPESICTNNQSKKLVENWFGYATKWNQNSRKNCMTSDGLESASSVKKSLLDGIPYSDFVSICNSSSSNKEGNVYEIICFNRKIKLPTGLTIPDILERTQKIQAENILLESSNAYESSTVQGRFSIIGLDVAKCNRIEYTVGEEQLRLLWPHSDGIGSEVHFIDKKRYGNAWAYIAKELEMVQVSIGNNESPFWGGFIGYMTYELGLESIELHTDVRPTNTTTRPDLCLVWLKSTIVVDHLSNHIYIQQLAPRSDENRVNNWMEDLIHKLVAQPVLNSSEFSMVEVRENEFPTKSTICSISAPDETDYISKVNICQSHIRSGSSYELCLTDQADVNVQGLDSAWNIYKRLRKSQPAPYASFIRIGSATFISASPERFLKWDEDGKCELRPMKGTVKKSPTVSTLDQAIAILNKPKEKAENLMIVDLTRHDLYGICGSGNVTVPRLMVVEEYASVFQMISIVSGQIPSRLTEKNTAFIHEGKLANPKLVGKGHTGLDVLASSLPPGSMTGAPKKRSCEILREIEQRERSLYSGVVGYIDVRGKGQWSVNIRCLFKWDDEVNISDPDNVTETYHIGAGGAVTALSIAHEEKDEMLVKLNSTLNIFKN